MSRTTRVLLLIAAALIPFVYIEHVHHVHVLQQYGLTHVIWDAHPDSSLCDWKLKYKGCELII